MKRFSVLLTLLVCAATNGVAQNPYADGVRVTADSITYEVKRDNRHFFMLQNVQNLLTTQNPIDLDGNPIEPGSYELGTLDMVSIKQAVTETFSDSELCLLKNDNTALFIYLTKDMNGKVLEVVFNIQATPAALAIPINSYMLFEKKLKQCTRWKTLSSDERNLQFSHESLLLNWNYLNIQKNPDAEIAPDSLQTNP